MSLTLRSDIIQTFRDRIHKETHFRLSTDDLQALIDGFIVELQGGKTEKKIQALCEAEIKLLEEGYPQASVAKYLTKYRKAIAIAIEDRKLTLTKATSHHYIHQQRVTGIEEKRHEHWALTYLKYSNEIYESIDKRPQPTVTDEPLNLSLVPVKPYLALLRDFLRNKGKFEARWLATAITGLTGRRFAEIVDKGTFSLTEHHYLLRFEGQLKSRAGHGEDYDIVTLFPAAEVLEAIQRLRKLSEVRAIAKLKGAELSTALNAFNHKLNSVTGKVLIQVVPPLKGNQSDLAQQLLKDPYCFDFLTISPDAQERELEKVLVEHIRDFLLELGMGFSFVGLLLYEFSKGGFLSPLPLMQQRLSKSLG